MTENNPQQRKKSFVSDVTVEEIAEKFKISPANVLHIVYRYSQGASTVAARKIHDAIKMDMDNLKVLAERYRIERDIAQYILEQEKLQREYDKLMGNGNGEKEIWNRTVNHILTNFRENSGKIYTEFAAKSFGESIDPAHEIFNNIIINFIKRFIIPDDKINPKEH